MGNLAIMAINQQGINGRPSEEYRPNCEYRKFEFKGEPRNCTAHNNRTQVLMRALGVTGVPHIAVVTTVAVEAGDELLVKEYGNDHWNSRKPNAGAHIVLVSKPVSY